MAPKKDNGFVYRPLPCPLYDVDRLESWLDDMAREGLLLVKNSLIHGHLAFRQVEPCELRYRLTARPLSAGEKAAAAPDTAAHPERYVWYRAGRLGEYCVYRAIGNGERQRNTDPQVHALALSHVKKRLFFDLGLLGLALALCVLLDLRRGLLLTMVGTGSWLFLCGAALLLWLLGGSLWAFAAPCLIRRALLAGRAVRPAAWRGYAQRYYISSAAQLLAVVLFLAAVLACCAPVQTDRDWTALDSYSGQRPFAGLEQLCPDGVEIYEISNPGRRRVRAWRDLLAPQNLIWNETARITLEGGKLLEAGLYVDYHRAATPGLAQAMADEYVRLEQRADGFRLLGAVELRADFAFACCDAGGSLHTVILRKGSVVVRALLWQGSAYTLSAQEWMGALADSIP